MGLVGWLVIERYASFVGLVEKTGKTWQIGDLLASPNHDSPQY